MTWRGVAWRGVVQRSASHVFDPNVSGSPLFNNNNNNNNNNNDNNNNNFISPKTDLQRWGELLGYNYIFFKKAKYYNLIIYIQLVKKRTN